MAVWGVTMLKNEGDVAYHTLMHAAEEHLDGLVVADNLSTDKTLAEIERAKLDLAGSCTVIVVSDPDPAHYQGRKVTALAALAGEHGATWIVPFDGDELWYSRHGPLGDVLRMLPADVWAVPAQVVNHFTTDFDVIGPTPYQSMVYHSTQPSALPKMAARWAPDMRIANGNHSVSFETGRPAMGHIAPGCIEIRHFPYRSPDQFVTKVRQGAAGVRATDLPAFECDHWRYYGAILDRMGEPALRSMYETAFHYPDPVAAGLALDPAPFRRWTQPAKAG